MHVNRKKGEEVKRQKAQGIRNKAQEKVPTSSKF
jgi:hypothetical protein